MAAAQKPVLLEGEGMSDWTDAQILTMLDLRADGHSCAEIGKRLGKTKNSVIGMQGRIRHANRTHDRQGIGNGTMPRYWWQDRERA